MTNFMLCLIFVVLMTCGQTLFKFATNGKEISSLRAAIEILFSPYLIIAIVLYVGGVFLWIYILTKIPMSYAYPIQVLTIPLVVILSLFFFREAIPAHRWIGIGIIVLGVLVASR